MERTCILVTGANRGYGEAVAKAFLSEIDQSSMLILHSRSGQVPWLEDQKYSVRIETIDGDLSCNIDWASKLKDFELKSFDTW